MIQLLFLLMHTFFQSSVYSIPVTGINGQPIDLSNFAGKKILLVNIATGGSRASQLEELQQLQQTYGDSLVIIGFPSNSFGNETHSNSEISSICQSQYGVSFLLAAKGSVKGEDQQAMFYFLTHFSENGAFNATIQGDFQKYLFNGAGQPIGIFTGSLSPFNPQLTNAITGNYN